MEPTPARSSSLSSPVANIPEWARNGGIAYCRWDGGPMEVAKALESGWDYITNPQAVTAMHDWFGDRGFELIRQAGFNWIWVTWSPGYSRQSERWQQDILRPFIARCQQHGVHVTTYMSMCNIFVEDVRRHQPELLDCLQRDVDGGLIPYGAARYAGEPGRLLCCLNHPEWRGELKRRLTIAIENGAEAAFYDNLTPWCQCPRCNERFRQYSRAALGVAMDIPPQKAALSPTFMESSATISNAVEVVPWQLLHAYYAELIDEVVAELTAHAETLDPQFMVYANWHVYFHSFGSPATKALTTEDGQLCCRLSPDAKMHSGVGFAVDGYISNAGLLLRMLASADGVRPLRMQSHISPAMSMESRHFQMYAGRQWQRLIAECWCFRASQEVFVEGNFQTALYAGEPHAEQAWDAIAQFNRFHAEHRDTWITADRSLACFAVLVLDRYPKQGADWQRVEWLTRLALQGLQFDVVLNHQLSRQRLSRYPILWIDACECLSDRELCELEGYLRDGGKICVSGPFAEKQAIGRARDCDALNAWLERLKSAGEFVTGKRQGMVPAEILEAQARFSVRVAADTTPVLWKCWADSAGRLVVMIFNPDDALPLRNVTVSVEGARAYRWFSPKDGGQSNTFTEGSYLQVDAMETFGYVLATSE